MQKKIALIGTAWPFRGGGIASLNERLARAFLEDGFDVTIYNFSLQYPSFVISYLLVILCISCKIS